MPTNEKELYSTTGFSAREHVRVDERADMDFAVTTPDGGVPDSAYTPEQLYAAAVASCLHQAVVLEASQAGLDTTDSTVRADVGLTHAGGQRFGLSVRAAVELPGVDDDTHARIVERAFGTFPMAGNVDIQLT